MGVIEKIDENGQFTLEDVNLQYTGTYKLVATVGDLDKGEFKALAKDAKVSLKVANRKYDGKLKVTSSYKLNEKGAAIAQIRLRRTVSIMLAVRRTSQSRRRSWVMRIPITSPSTLR